MVDIGSVRRAPPTPRTLDALLAWRAEHEPDAVAYTFLVSDGEPATITWRQVHARAVALAGELPRGRPVLLVHRAGLEFPAAFFACLYAGAIPVAVHPPQRSSLELFEAIAEDAEPAAVLGPASTLDRLPREARSTPAVREAAWIVQHDEETDAPSRLAAPDRSELAYLQYTSGSTSKPRGVMISHGALIEQLEYYRLRAGPDWRQSRLAGWLPHQHDYGLVGFVLSALYMGTPYTFMAPAAFLREPARWIAAISSTRSTYSGAPAFAYDLCARTVDPEVIAGLDLSAWTIASSGGEPIAAATLDRFAERFAPYGFDRAAWLPSYGLAEAVLCVSARRGVRVRRGHISLGSPMPGQQVIVVDPETRRRCDDGECGEVWVGGRSLASGYWRRSQETAAAFGAVPGDVDAHGSYLRTGDIGFIDGGELHIVDRLKDVLVVRGVNHHALDVERTVQAADPVLIAGAGAAIQLERDGRTDVIVVQEALPASAARNVELCTRIRAAVSEAHGLDIDAVVLLAPRSISRTASGKVRRHALRDAWRDGRLQGIGGRVFTAPTGVATAVAELWREALGPAADGGVDDFFALGGDSLAAARILAGISRRYGVELPARVLVTHRAVASLALEVERQVAEAPASTLTANPPTDASLLEVLGRLERAEARLAALEARLPAPEAETELSGGQRLILHLQELAPEATTAMHIASVLELPSGVGEATVRGSLQQLARRHDAMRTVIDPKRGAARVLPEATVKLATAAAPADLAAWLRDDQARPFDLSAAPPWRATLLHTDPARLIVLVHHAILDGASMRTLAAELAAACSGAELPAAGPPPGDHSDHAQAATDDERAQARAAYELRLLEQAGSELPLLELPSDRAAPPRLSLAAATHTALAGADLRRALVALGARSRATLFATLLAGYTALLHRLSGQDAIVIGFGAAGRERPEAEGFVGHCARELPLVSRIDSDPTVAEHVARTRDLVLDALEHQDVTLARLLELRRAPVDPARPLRVATSFNLEPLPALADGFRLDCDLPMRSLTRSLSELEAKVTDTGSGLRFDFTYSTARFDAPTVERWMQSFLLLLEGMAAHPARPVTRLPILTEADRARLARWSVAPETEPSPAYEPLASHFARQAARSPSAIAVIAPDETLSYGELRARAAAHAAHLRAAGMRPGTVVALLAERGAGFLAALLGILEARGTVLALSPSEPRRRLTEMLLGGDARHLLVGEGLMGVAVEATRELALSPVELPTALAAGAAMVGAAVPVETAARRDPAYVVYTSGSTGTPKGAVVAHDGMVNHLLAKVDVLGLTSADIVAQTASQSFDIYVWQCLAPLMVGGTAHVLPDSVTGDPVQLLRAADQSAVTILEVVPSQLRALLDDYVQRAAGRPRLAALRWIIPTGEALVPELCRRWMRFYSRVPLLNAYGPAECSDDVAHHVLTWPPGADVARVPIGRPIRGARLHVLDRHRAPVVPGSPGELYIGGVAVGLGYKGDPEQTAAAFVRDPADASEMLYCTGDLVRHRPDGALEYLGRIDDQQKLHGIRLEPAEVEAVLGRHAAVGDCAVTVHETPDGTRFLAGYVAPSNDALPPSAELRRHLRTRLPPALVPATITALAALPRTASGKLDRRALPAPVLERNGCAGPHVAPRTTIEREVAAIVAAILHQEVGMLADFFELGGRSLEAARLSAGVRAGLGVELPVYVIYQDPTLVAIARYVDSARTAGEAEGELNGPPVHR